MAGKRVNPRKIPKTQADVDRAVDAATKKAVEQAFKMMLYILLDKHGAPADEVQQFSDELAWLARSLYSDGPSRLSWKDVQRVLDEYDVSIKFN